MIKKLDIYIFRELFEPFIFGLGAFTAIMSASMVLFELVRAVIIHGLPLLVALQVFVYRLPGIAVYIFPMATLLAALLAFSRLSHDSEIIAFKRLGHLALPPDRPGPGAGRYRLFHQLALFRDRRPRGQQGGPESADRHDHDQGAEDQKNVFIPEIERGELKRIFYAESMQGKTMSGVIVQEFTDGKLSQIINAKEASWQPDTDQWLFRDGSSTCWPRRVSTST